MIERVRALLPRAGYYGWGALAVVLVALILRVPAVYAINPIQLENAKPGTTAWQLTNPARNREIEGYASLTSVQRGDTISFFVNTPESTYTMRIFRMGWYGGAGAREMVAPITRTGISQPMPTPAPGTGLIECNWTNPYVLTVPNNTADPTDWASGFYLVQLTAGQSGKQSYIVFVVRDDARAANYLFQSSVTTYQAYNVWGGKGLYGNISPLGQARKVSFNRPYAASADPSGAYGNGAGEFLTICSSPPTYNAYKAAWEYNMVRFLEREGYDVTYCTDIDTHSNANLLLTHKGFLVVGHDEYWTWQMRANVEAARDQGVGLGIFGANTCYWQIRLEPSTVSGAANRTIVGYKEAALAEDPFYLDGNPSNDYLVTTRWRDGPVNRPEDAFVGVMYEIDLVNADMVIYDASHWVCAGTGLQNGDHLRGLVGDEADRMWGNAPPNTALIAHSPYPGGRYADVVAYTAPSGAIVFATGSMYWCNGLDDYNAPALRPSVLSPAAQQMTRNVLAAFLSPPVTPPPSHMPPGSSLIDDFNDNTRDSTKWGPGTSTGAMYSTPGAWDAGVSVLEQNQRLEIVPRAGITGLHYNSYLSAASWDLTNANVSVQVVQVAGGGTTDTGMAVGSDALNGYLIETESGRIYFTQAIGGARTSTSVVYNAAQHRYWRIRHDAAANTMVFETSADRVTWAVQRTVPRQLAITTVKVELAAGTWERVTAPGTAIFDNFRLEPNGGGSPANQPPVANAGGPYTGTVNQPVTFNGGGSTDPDGTIASYQWNFGDNSTGTGATPTHTYVAAAVYTVTLTVTDNGGASTGTTTTVNVSAVPNQSPVARPGGPYTGTAGQAVAFNGDTSSDPDGSISGYQWSFGDGGTGTGASPTHSYAAAGTYTVTLTVTDNRGATASATTTATISAAPNQVPTARPGGPYSGTAGQPVAFNGSSSTDPDGTITSYQWSFGDGGNGTGATPAHTYAAAGSYTVTLTVTDNRGAAVSAATTANISPAAPPTASLVDDFDDNARDAAKWSFGTIQGTVYSGAAAWDAALPVLEQNQRLEIAPRANQTGDHYNGYLSAATWNLTGANASVEVVQIAGGGSADTAFAVCVDAQNFYLMETESGRLYFTQVVGGVRTETSVAYSATQHRYWRIRHDAATNMIAFETSANRATWTARRTVPRQLSITAMRVELSAGTWERVSAPGTAIFDNFRLEAN